MPKTYLVEELFQDIPDDPDNVMFTIPPEICQEAGLKEGDTIHIEASEGKLIFKKVNE